MDLFSTILAKNSANGGGASGGVTQEYVDEKDTETLKSANAFTTDAISKIPSGGDAPNDLKIKETNLFLAKDEKIVGNGIPYCNELQTTFSPEVYEGSDMQFNCNANPKGEPAHSLELVAFFPCNELIDGVWVRPLSGLPDFSNITELPNGFSQNLYWRSKETIGADVDLKLLVEDIFMKTFKGIKQGIFEFSDVKFLMISTAFECSNQTEQLELKDSFYKEIQPVLVATPMVLEWSIKPSTKIDSQILTEV